MTPEQVLPVDGLHAFAQTDEIGSTDVMVHVPVRYKYSVLVKRSSLITTNDQGPALLDFLQPQLLPYRNKLECLQLIPPKSNICGQGWKLTIGEESRNGSTMVGSSFASKY